MLLATALFAVFGAIGSLAGISLRKPAWGVAAANAGLVGGFVCGAILAIVLIQNGPAEPTTVRVFLGRWATFPGPQSLTLQFGLETTWLKACFVSALGGMLFLVQRPAGWLPGPTGSHRLGHEPVGSGQVNIGRTDKSPTGMSRTTRVAVSEHVNLSISMFYAAAVFFSLAPNLSQALLGWGVMSLIAVVLIRLIGVSIGKEMSIAKSFRSQSEGYESTSHWLHVLRNTIQRLEKTGIVGAWHVMSHRLPGWLGEQTEIIEQSTVPIQLLATALGSFAILLTWLVVS